MNLAWLNGNRTYITAGLGALALWLAYLTGAADPSCVPTPILACAAVTLQGAISGSIAILMLVFMRAGSKDDANNAAVAVVSASKSMGATEAILTGAKTPIEVGKGDTTAVDKPVAKAAAKAR